MDYGDDVPTLKKMTQAEHDGLVGGGCDPYCHACDAKINVGDWWSFKLFVPSGQIVGPTGLVLGSIRGTACETCIKSDRGLSTEERASLENRLRKATAKPEQPTPKPEPKSHPMSAGHGCFVLEDGTRF